MYWILKEMPPASVNNYFEYLPAADEQGKAYYTGAGRLHEVYQPGKEYQALLEDAIENSKMMTTLISELNIDVRKYVVIIDATMVPKFRADTININGMHVISTNHVLNHTHDVLFLPCDVAHTFIDQRHLQDSASEYDQDISDYCKHDINAIFRQGACLWDDALLKEWRKKMSNGKRPATLVDVLKDSALHGYEVMFQPKTEPNSEDCLDILVTKQLSGKFYNARATVDFNNNNNMILDDEQALIFHIMMLRNKVDKIGNGGIES